MWRVDPRFKTVIVYRGNAEPQLFNITQILADKPRMPGLSAAVNDLFD